MARNKYSLLTYLLIIFWTDNVNRLLAWTCWTFNLEMSRSDERKNRNTANWHILLLEHRSHHKRGLSRQNDFSVPKC